MSVLAQHDDSRRVRAGSAVALSVQQRVAHYVHRAVATHAGNGYGLRVDGDRITRLHVEQGLRHQICPMREQERGNRGFSCQRDDQTGKRLGVVGAQHQGRSPPAYMPGGPSGLGRGSRDRHRPGR